MKKTIKLMALLLTLALSSMVQAATVNLNTATKAELMTLKGVGEARAEAIMKYRRGNKFTKPSDVQNVPGIGEVIYKDNARSMKASGRTTAKPEMAKAKDKPVTKRKASKDKVKKDAKASKKAKADKKVKKEKKPKKEKKAKKDTTKKKLKKKSKKKGKKKAKKKSKK